MIEKKKREVQPNESRGNNWRRIIHDWRQAVKGPTTRLHACRRVDFHHVRCEHRCEMTPGGRARTPAHPRNTRAKQRHHESRASKAHRRRRGRHDARVVVCPTSVRRRSRRCQRRNGVACALRGVYVPLWRAVGPPRTLDSDSFPLADSPLNNHSL